MPARYRILSFHHITNYGAFLFAYSLLRLLQADLTPADVKIIDYRSPRLAIYESLKRFKIFQSIPLFYNRRSRLWQEMTRRYLDLDTNFPRFASQKELQRYWGEYYNGLVVGMDVWCLTHGTERPLFPNIYWLPEKIGIPKVAYGVSGYNSNRSLIDRHRNEITSYLNDFDIIGARDRFTLEMVLKHRTRTTGLVAQVPDPAFLYKIKPTGIREKLVQVGIDFNRPILGLLLFGNARFSEVIQQYYHTRGYQIIGLSMYNPKVDLNLGHILTPFEWAEIFRLCTFCITDRFHGTIFCLKNRIPFISLEKDNHLPPSQSKILDLLSSFDLTCCYQKPQEDGFYFSDFFAIAQEIECSWEQTFKPGILPKIGTIQEQHWAFMKEMRRELNW